MLRRILVMIAATAAGAAVLTAAGPVGTVSSRDAFTLRGATVPVAGVPSWPLSDGDEIAAGKSPALITFKDGSRVYLNAGSRARLRVEGKQPVLRLMKGELAYKVSRRSPAGVAAGDRAVLPGDSEEGLLMLKESGAVWAPAGGTRSAVMVEYQINPFNMGFLDTWREYRPPFGVPPGQGTTGPQTPPPGQVTGIVPAPMSVNKPATP